MNNFHETNPKFCIKFEWSLLECSWLQYYFVKFTVFSHWIHKPRGQILEIFYPPPTLGKKGHFYVVKWSFGYPLPENCPRDLWLPFLIEFQSNNTHFNPKVVSHLQYSFVLYTVFCHWIHFIWNFTALSVIVTPKWEGRSQFPQRCKKRIIRLRNNTFTRRHVTRFQHFHWSKTFRVRRLLL